MMFTPMDNCRGGNGVTPLVMLSEQSGWYTIVAAFEVKKEIPAERLIYGP
jgi:hypothetical protein